MQITFCVGALIAIGASVWFFAQNVDTRSAVYATAILMGSGGSIMLVTSFSFIATLIGDDKVKYLIGCRRVSICQVILKLSELRSVYTMSDTLNLFVEFWCFRVWCYWFFRQSVYRRHFQNHPRFRSTRWPKVCFKRYPKQSYHFQIVHSLAC